jgi:hypothetical protein
MALGSDTDALQWMHEHVSAGEQDVIIGTVAMRSNIEVSSKADQHSKPVDKKQHVVEATTSQWELLVTLANDFEGVALPRNSDEAKRFVTVASTLLHKFQRGCALGAPHTSTDDPDPSDMYIHKAILQKIILWLQTRTLHEIWEPLTMGDMQGVMLDTCDLMASRIHDWTCQQANRVFGCNPYMVYYWAYLFHGVTQANRVAFEQQPEQHSLALWNTVCKLKETTGLEPNLDTTARHVLSSAEEMKPPLQTEIASGN